MTDASTARAEPTRPLPEQQPFPGRGARHREMDRPLREFLEEESALLDDRQYQDWLDLLEDDFLYQVPVPLLREDPDLSRHSDRAMLFEATKHVFALKLGRLGLRHAWSDRPGGVVRHFLGPVRVFATHRVGTWRVECGVLATWNRGRGESATVTASRQDIVTDLGGGSYRLLRRRALLDIEVPTHEQLSIIF
ncbi:aromatic-ring-hydroxylating dioxygenase subunit beta [Streptomyces sp. MB09-01]|uniref:aromatic-ring-hydroxylating dioxygenase subunit beta n=1 Tax=Streptomyces sp. MB09-01 TaxID=3028666 RepID=UPI0029A2C945|nr:aromatic-ring-hydroxylating dioxygenase subunit beta [Streptomyces sp. MB09-01]MDX3535560.1 aromatic-ring-hydroxylating dioxygenase subunit beta [Streptomyces sp. MB09-01]